MQEIFCLEGRKEKETLKRKIVIANARKSVLLLRQVRRYDDDLVIIVSHLFVSSAVVFSITTTHGAKLSSKRVGDKATCVACNATLMEIEKDIRDKSKFIGPEEVVIESMTNVCSEVKRFVTYNYPPPQMQSACREIIGTYEEKIERLMYSYAKTVEKNKKKNDDSSSTKSMSEAQEKAMMDDIFMKVCTREACKGIDLETYMEIEKSETGIKTSGIERTGQFADQDEL